MTNIFPRLNLYRFCLTRLGLFLLILKPGEKFIFEFIWIAKFEIDMNREIIIHEIGEKWLGLLQMTMFFSN